MKHLLLILTIISSVTVAQANQEPLSFLREVVEIEDDVFRGQDGRDTKCWISTKWLKNGDLLVKATSKHKNWDAITHVVRFSAERAGVETQYEEGTELTHMAYQEKDVMVDGRKGSLTEYMNVYMRDGHIEGMDLNIRIDDFESDAIEHSVYCNSLK